MTEYVDLGSNTLDHNTVQVEVFFTAFVIFAHFLFSDEKIAVASVFLNNKVIFEVEKLFLLPPEFSFFRC